MSSNNQDIKDILVEHNLDIKDTKERVSKLEQKACAPVYAAIPPESMQALSQIIATQVLTSIERDCVLPELDLSGAQSAISSAAEAGVTHALEHHSIQIENTTVHTLPVSLQTAIDSLKVLLEKNIETGIVGWKRKVQEWAVWGCCVLIAGMLIVGIIFFTSPQYWGARYYKVCNHPLQQNEKLVERQYCAYEDVIRIFDNGRKDKKQMKAYIRLQEQQLKKREIEHGKGE